MFSFGIAAKNFEVFWLQTQTAGKHRAQEIDRESALQTSQNEDTNMMPFTLTYHPQLSTTSKFSATIRKIHIVSTTYHFIQTLKKRR